MREVSGEHPDWVEDSMSRIAYNNYMKLLLKINEFSHVG